MSFKEILLGLAGALLLVLICCAVGHVEINL